MEQALQESEANYRQLFHHAPAGIYEFDMQERRFISVNDVMCEYTGYSEAEFMKLDVVDLLSDDSLSTLGELLEKAAAGDSNPDPVEYRIKGKNQREFWVLVHSRFSYDTDGNPWKVTGVAHDITQRRQAEEENKRLEKKLMQAQKMEALGTLSGGIAHDFNNLMTGILGNTSLMLFDLDENHIYHDRLKQIEHLVKRGASLTRQLLGLSRQGKFQALPINLNNLVRESVEIYGRTKKDIQIHTNLQENVWTVVADRGQIEQVLLNLFINAWQAMPKGGSLYIETNNYFLDEAQTRPLNLPVGRYVKISVTDTGIGMEALSVYAARPGGFDMVILDMVMPGMGGPQTFERLKQIDAHVKVLLSSGYSINEQVKTLLSVGCKGFIQKPFTVHEFSQKVGNILAQSG